MRFRGKSIRRKIVVLLLVPLVSLVSIWGFATYITGRQAAQLLGTSDAMEKLGKPGQDVGRAIQRERRQVLVYLADPRSSEALARLHRIQNSTDQAVRRVRANSSDSELRSALQPNARSSLDDFLDSLKGLKKVRTRVEESAVTRGGAYQAYNEVADPCYAFLATLRSLSDVDLEEQGRALVGLDRAREYLSREDALMAAALTSGKMTGGDRRAFSDRIAERERTYQVNLQMLPALERQEYEKFWSGTDGRTLRSAEDSIIASGNSGNIPVSADSWDSATSAVRTDLERLSHESDVRYQKRIDPLITKVILQAGAASVLGFIAVLTSLIISIRVGRSLVRDLGSLRKEANDSAGVRLPSVMRRLAAGEEVDVETEAPRLVYPEDEMGQVGQALNTLQRSAVEAAVKQADMRRGVSEVFVNLARRNQVLLHRQLTLLDTMERRTEDADELADLFRLDHLTTRMRRHAEGLVILSGSAPSRQWRKPVQLMDVVRAAVAEVEDYERVEVRRLPRLAMDGGAVADLTHLIAELLENATVFSPPHTAVQVLGERVANGFTLEIHDRGLGMPPDAILDANLRLAETPEFELSDTDRLGLFVVSRLAQRHGVRVSLQPSPYGGTTAVVLIPGAILTETPPSGSGQGGDTLGDGSLDSLPTARARRLEIGTQRGALEGPVELESPADGPDGPADTPAPPPGRPDPAPSGRSPLRGEGPESEQHQPARDETEQPRPATESDSARPAGQTPGSGAAEPAPLPRRRPGAGGPVLVADNGRTVGDGARLPRREKRRDTPQQPEQPQQPQAGPNSTTAAGGSPDTDPASGEPESAAPDAATATTGGPRPAQSEDSATVSGLPRRVRQANLAPQLKKDTRDRHGGDPGGEPAASGGHLAPGGPEPDADGEAGTSGVDGHWEREADQVRSRMASLQRGWQRGRQDNAARSGDTSPEASGDPAQRTTPEGDGP